MVVTSVCLWLAWTLLLVEGRNVGFTPQTSTESWWMFRNGSSPWRQGPSSPLPKAYTAPCTCTPPTNCRDTLQVNLRSANHEEECAGSDICCQSLFDQLQFNDVDQNLPLAFEETTSPTDHSRGRSTTLTIPVLKAKGTTEETISAGDLANEEDEEEVEKQCGVVSQDLHIISKGGGEDVPADATNFGEYPWTLLILVSEEGGTPHVHCGATLLDDNLAVTAAHCVVGMDIKSIIVRAGEWDVNSIEEQEPHQDRKVSCMVKHENYTEEGLRNDIALLFFDVPFNLAIHIKKLCLPKTEDKYAKKCIATGWGSRGASVDPGQQAKMKQVSLNIILRKECQRLLRQTIHGPDFKLKASFFCAKGQDNEEDTCLGDGGGPLFCRDTVDRRYVFVGITSWGDCTDRKAPGVYVNVIKFDGWIMDKLDDMRSETRRDECRQHTQS